MLGIYLPLQIGRALVEGPWSLLASVFIPMMLVGMMIPESFAGERERHTTPIMALANITLSLLMASFVAGLGVLISLRAATVQEAQQTLMTATLFPLVLLQMIPLLLLNVVPDGKALLKDLVAAADPTQIILIVMTVLVMVDLVLLIGAIARFKRARLILS
jgi:ABC-2 type transport system permease protein